MRRCARRRALFLQPTKRRTDDLVDSVAYGLLGAGLAHADRAGAAQAPNLPTRAPVYRGTATNTHTLSPEWASGIATAWTISVENTSSTFLPHIYVDGSTLYVASNATIKGEPGDAVTVTAYDVSGAQPTQLWSSTGHTKTTLASTYTPTFVSSDDQLFFHDVVIDKKTGEQTQAPWA